MENKNNACDCQANDIKLVNKIKTEIISDNYISQLSSFFKVLAENTRMKIICVISENEVSVNDIAVILNMTKSTVSHQLKILKTEGYVKVVRHGKNIYYSLDDQHVVNIIQKALEHIKHMQ